MKTMIKTFWFILVLAVSAGATNYTVKAGGGGNYTTIQACATAMSAGDTCTVYTGTYPENVSVSSGTAGNYKTMTVNGSDVVTVISFSIGSHVKVIGNCPLPSTQGTCGFSIQNTSSPNTQPCVSINANSTDYYITNNNLYTCKFFVEESASGNTTFGYIQGNTMSWAWTTPIPPATTSTWGGAGIGLQIVGNHHLIENNDISHANDAMIVYGAHNVVRKNNYHDQYLSDCLVNGNGSNCHSDFIHLDANVTGGTIPATYALIEGNTINNMVNINGHAMGLFQAESCNGECQNAIVRFNVASHIGGGAVLDDSGVAPPPQQWINVHVYNNSWIDVNNQANSAGSGTHGFAHGAFGGADINDLFYYVGSLSNFNPYFCLDTACSPFTYANNLAWCTGGTCSLHGHTYGSGLFTSDPGNISADPKFVDYVGNNFDLAAGSPAIGAGTNLTTVAAGDSGSGTSLVVNDAGFFQDGSGIAGVNADCIAVTTVAHYVCITAVDYQTKTLTLASSVTRSAGDPVWLYSDSTGRTVLTGSAPNIGATFDPPSGPAPPTGLAALVN